MNKYIYISIEIDGEPKHCVKIEFIEHIKHEVNRYWYEVWTPGKNKTLHTGELEFDIGFGELSLISVVMSRAVKRKKDNKKEKESSNGN